MKKLTAIGVVALTTAGAQFAGLSAALASPSNWTVVGSDPNNWLTYDSTSSVTNTQDLELNLANQVGGQNVCSTPISKVELEFTNFSWPSAGVQQSGGNSYPNPMSPLRISNSGQVVIDFNFSAAFGPKELVSYQYTNNGLTLTVRDQGSSTFCGGVNFKILGGELASTATSQEKTITMRGLDSSNNVVLSTIRTWPLLATTQPSLTIANGMITRTSGVWNNRNGQGSSVDYYFACPAEITTAQTSVASSTPQGCSMLSGVSNTIANASVFGQPYNAATHGAHIVLASEFAGQYVWTRSVLNTGGSSSGSGSSGSVVDVTAESPKYSGPEFSSFGAPVLAGNKLVSEGKRLDGITSLKVNGQAVTYKINSASQLEIDVPSNLAPGQYDVEITSAHGKLTHLKAFTVKAVVPTKDQAFKVDGGWFNYGDLLALTNTAKTIGDEYTSVKCIVNGADAAIAERLAKRACDYIGATRLRGKAITHEAKSTFTGSGYWVRVIANG